MTNGHSRDAIYEVLRERVAASLPASSAHSRDVEWTSSSRTLGFARSSNGAIEVFLVGEPLQASRPGVAKHLEHHQWATVDGEGLSATRLLLPNEPHFDRVAAFICAELQLNNVDDSVPAAFRRSEEIIDLALTRASVDADALLGLCGELLFLDALIRADPDSATRTLMQSWAGHQRSSRDLQLGSIGVEVKTTAKAASVHHIQGPHQVELGNPVGGVQETGLFLLSIGLVWLPNDQPVGFTLHKIVSTLTSTLNTGDRAEFLGRISGYAGSAGRGYEHDSPEIAPEFRRPFTTSFVRLYDMTDSRIRLPRSDVLSGMDLVPESVSYRIRLPLQVNGSLNPTIGLAEAAAHVLAISK